MDLRMPKMDGIETLKRIRAFSDNPNAKTPIIALSAHIAEHEYKNLIATGFDDYLIKPVMKNTLFSIVKKWIQSKSENTQHEHPVIDWELGLKLAGNKREIAEEMLEMLTMNLAEEVKKIHDSYKNKNYKQLQQQVHKLHGAVCYCGTPRLKKAISTLENALKQNDIDLLPALLENFELESHALLQAMVT